MTAPRAQWPAALMVIVFGALVWTAIAMPASRFGMSGQPEKLPVAQMGDQIRWHEPAVRAFAAQFPRFNLAEYDSAIAPGYYIVMATVAQAADSRLALQLVNSLFGMALVISLLFILSRFVDDQIALLLVLPLGCSPYFVATSIWMNTDNFATLLVLWAIFAMIIVHPTPRTITIGIAIAALTVFVRQIHLWAIAPALLLILLSAPAIPRSLSRQIIGESLDAWTWPRVTALAIAALAPFVVLALLVAMWGGMTPPNPRIESLHQQGVNPSAFAFALGLLGVFGAFFAPLLGLNWREWGKFDAAIWVAIGAATTACLPWDVVLRHVLPIPARTAEQFNGPLWLLADATGLPIDFRSLALIPAAAFGTIFLIRTWRVARDAGHQRSATLLLLSLLGWLIAQSMNAQVWQRYYEPIILIAVAILVSLGWKGERPITHPMRYAPIAFLILIQLALTAARVYVPLFMHQPSPGGMGSAG